jgi:DNA ligase-1
MSDLNKLANQIDGSTRAFNGSVALQRAFDVLTAMENTGSRNEKQALLEANADNEYLKKMFFYAYNPFLKFYVTKYGEVNPKGEGDPQHATFDSFLNLLNALSSRTYTGHEALSMITLFFEKLTPEEYKWYSRVLLKDLRVGATDSLANKVWKDLIPVFECMLAKPWEDVKKKPSMVYVEPKLDGYRCLAFVKSGTVEMFTRNGKAIEGFTDIEKELSTLPDGVYDGEITGKDKAFNDMQKQVFKKGGANKQGFFNIFDTLPISAFERGKSKQPIGVRKGWVVDLIGEADKPKFQHLRTVEFSGPMAYDDPRVDELYRLYLERGYEGIMVKDADSVYECKRSAAWAKIKPTDTYDLEVVGYEEGTGKNAGKLGALIVEYKGFKVNVGSGYTDAMREEFWADRNNLVGRVIEIEAQESTENQKGEQSLRFPIFKGFRHDK